MGQKLVADTSQPIEKLSSTKISLPAGASITIGGQQASNLIDSICNITVSGVGGLDTGSITNDTTYYVHAVTRQNVANEGNLALVASLSGDLPSGYAVSAVIGRFTTDGSGNIDRVDDSKSNEDDALLEALKSQLGTVEIKYIDAPHTEIVNRAQIPDLANDLGSHAGINRIMTQEAYEIQGEQGPAGEPVFGVVNDKFGQIRFVGDWNSTNDTGGPRASTGTDDVFVEITFYGTGLNHIAKGNGVRDFRATVDGGAEGSNYFPSSASSVLAGRNYSPNVILSVVSGLPLGIHTVKIRHESGGINVYGFEILNESANIKINPGQLLGGKQLAGHSSPFATSFNLEEGTNQGAGGHVVLYEHEGVIKKAVNWAADSQGDLGSANHSNEEVIARHNFREFGAGRGDDFSTLTTSVSDRAFTLDDGTTTLVGNDIRQPTAVDAAGFNNTGFITLTFVGTGLAVLGNDGVAAAVDPTNVYIDGSLVGTITANTLGGKQYLDIVSGLPYGTHTVKLERTVISLGSRSFSDFIIYGPKKPTLPEDAIELSSYNLMADFDASTAATVTSGGLNETIKGSLSKSSTREMVYVGSGWGASINIPQYQAAGWEVGSNVSSDYFEYTFFGTDISILFRATSNLGLTFNIDIDGVPNSSGSNLVNVSNSGGGAYAATTTDSARPLRVSFTGLSLGIHTIRVTLTASGFLNLQNIVVGTPIHTPKRNGPVIKQNTARIGSQGVKDLRKFSSKDVKESSDNVNTAVPFEGSSSGTSNTPVKELNTSYYMDEDGEVMITAYSPMWNATANTNALLEIFVDGRVAKTFVTTLPTSNSSFFHGGSFRYRLAKGEHNIHAQFRTNAGTINIGSFQSAELTVRRIYKV